MQNMIADSNNNSLKKPSEYNYCNKIILNTIWGTSELFNETSLRTSQVTKQERIQV